MRNVTHHIKGRAEYFKGLRKFLKPEGKVFVIDYKKERPDRFHKLSSHYVSREVIIDDMRNAGYEPVEEHDFLPVQNFIIFQAEKDD
jgi:roadblock/LC7 domain-containing protein